MYHVCFQLFRFVLSLAAADLTVGVSISIFLAVQFFALLEPQSAR